MPTNYRQRIFANINYYYLSLQSDEIFINNLCIMKLFIWCLCALALVGCGKDDDIEIQQKLKSSGDRNNIYHALWTTPIINLEDTCRVVAFGSITIPEYDSCIIRKLQVNLPAVRSKSYSVTNDSAVFIVTFWSPTKYNSLNHPVFLKLSDKIIQINFNQIY